MDSFDSLYEQYSKDVFRFLYRLCTYNQDLAEDLTQETFLHAYLGIAKFRGECSVKTWLLQIARNRFFMHLRSRKRESLDIPFHELIPDIVEQTSDGVLDKLYQEQLLSDSLEIIFDFQKK